MKRLTRLMDICLNNLDGSVEVQAILSRLDFDESNIFSVSQDALREFEQWKVGVTSKITTSKTVINQRKRKRTEDN